MSEQALFWHTFQQHAPSWASDLQSGREQFVFERIDMLLETCRLPFCFDVTHDASSCMLIFSPEGDEACAKEIDQFVIAVPVIPKWTVFSRRQRKSIEDACAIVNQLYLVNPFYAQFRIQEKNNYPFIQMFVSPDADLRVEEKQGLMNTFLWHFFGEDTVMTKRIDGEVLFANPDSEHILTADELAKLF